MADTAIPSEPGLSRGWRAGLGVTFVAAVIWIGAKDWTAPWIQGDELIFIVNNPDVTGAGRSDPTLERWLGIFTKVHEDLYQPIPIVTYAIEWGMAGPDGAAASVRRTDVFIHALNGLLVWLVFATLLTRLGLARRRNAELLAWSGALLWAMHPTLAGAYAADMGRTHMLAAGFALLGLWLHVRCLDVDRGQLFWGALAAYACAMMCKVIPGLFVVIFLLEVALLGIQKAVRSPRVYAIAAVCIGFTLLNYATTRGAGLTEDAAVALFGDPIARSLLAAWIHVRDTFWPVGLAVWYPPDVHLASGWSYMPVWGGALAIAAGLGIAAFAMARRMWAIAIGLIWFWVTLAPVLGLVGARAAAAHDRYAYLPLIGLILAVVALVARAGRAKDARPQAIWPAAGAIVLVALILAPLSRALGGDARTMIRRMERAAARDPADPRLIEGRAMAYSFSANHPTPEGDARNAPDFEALCVQTLTEAAAAAEKSARYFRDSTDRAAFHRRLSYRLLELGAAADALAQARRAQDFEPDAPLTWTRLAAAYRATGQIEKAREAFEQVELVMPASPEFRALRYTEWGDLLLNRFNRPDLALPKFKAALETHVAPVQAGVGAARCEVLAGNGAAGLKMAASVLEFDPENVEAMLIVSMYHLNSGHFQQAYEAYGAIIGRYPELYEALRGFNEACGQLNKWRDAALAWQNAVAREPNNPVFQSFFAWSATLAGEENAPRWVERLLQQQPDNRLGHAARMIERLRANELRSAVESAKACLAGKPQPLAREFERADAALRLLGDRKQISPDADLLRALFREKLGDAAGAAALARGVVERAAKSPLHDEARAVIARCEAVATAPASSSAPATQVTDVIP